MANYRLLDINGIDVTPRDLQAKGAWCETGAKIEEVFVKRYGEQLGLVINPEKGANRYAPDLVDTKTKGVGDLKTQNTPFFQARPRFGLDPQYTVVFNEKDAERYGRLYPDIEIYFWVDWVAVTFIGSTTISVEPMIGIWFIPFRELQKLLAKAPIHPYAQRTNDIQGNAKGSYVLDLQNPAFQRVG